MKKFIVLALLLFTVSCANKPIYSVASRPMPPAAKNLTLDRLEQAIVEGGQARRWFFDAVAPGRLRATQDQGKHLAIVEILFDQSNYSINLVRTSGLKEQGATISRHYNTWVRNLEDDIYASLVRASYRTQ